MSEQWSPRLATEADIPELEELIALSARKLQIAFYTASQIEAAVGPVFAVDRQLIDDGTYFVVEDAGKIVGCGGWSRREALYGGDRTRPGKDRELDPSAEPARVRAFFVHPAWARRGIGSSLLIACEDALFRAGFARAELVATLAGEPLYASAGYVETERFEAPLANGLTLEVVRMGKSMG